MAGLPALMPSGLVFSSNSVFSLPSLSSIHFVSFCYTELYTLLHACTFSCLRVWGTWYLWVLLSQGGLLVSRECLDQHPCFPRAWGFHAGARGQGWH